MSAGSSSQQQEEEGEQDVSPDADSQQQSEDNFQFIPKEGQQQTNQYYFIRDDPPETILEVNSIEYTDGQTETMSMAAGNADISQARFSPYYQKLKENENYIYKYRKPGDAHRQTVQDKTRKSIGKQVGENDGDGEESMEDDENNIEDVEAMIVKRKSGGRQKTMQESPKKPYMLGGGVIDMM